MNDIYIFNTATSKKEKFVPIDEKNVRMYVCGPTVYDDIHIGNARPLIVFDVMYRLLNLKYAGHVKYVRNITDIDDKIINRAREKNITPEQLTTQTIADFHAITTALDCEFAIEPRATQHIDDMKTMIAQLVEKKFAYEKDGHVLFDVSKMPDYGKFAKRPLDDLIAGARVEVAPYKKSPLDFVLWKPAKDGEPSFHSPWGDGRPGWHIECSAMAEKELGGHFDIHGGGQDLIFPHHQNELAQSTGCGHAFANYWMHNGFILINGKKMSKSEGNFITVKDLLEKQKISRQVLRLLMLSTHYRQPLDFTEAKLQEMMNVWDKIQNMTKIITKVFPSEELFWAKAGGVTLNQNNRMIKMLSDDLDTINFFKEFYALMTNINKNNKRDDMIEFFHAMTFLGIEPRTRDTISHENTKFVSLSKNFGKTLFFQQILLLNGDRLKLKKEKDFAAADNLRKQIEDMGFSVRDEADGTTLITEK
ncbi:MAG: cysteine--tRNA ligase [Hydrotalea sp.]|nr:cysteine--tRNA ligase [Hydrotalea sp.]